MDTVHVKTTQDGRPVEVIDGWVCLAGQPETDADRKSTRLNSSHNSESRMPSSA
jgi:hypothetical protein